jgi:hypothetical protein
MAHHFVDGISSSGIPHECTSLSGGDIWAKSIGTNTMNWYIHDSMPYYIYRETVDLLSGFFPG